MFFIFNCYTLSPAGASHILACRYSATLARAYYKKLVATLLIIPIIPITLIIPITPIIPIIPITLIILITLIIPIIPITPITLIIAITARVTHTP